MFVLCAVASFGADAFFELTGNGKYTNRSISGGRATFASITAGDKILSAGETLDGRQYSWSIAFDMEITNGKAWKGANMVFSTGGGANGSGVGILATHNNGNITYYLVNAVSDEKARHIARGDSFTVASGSRVKLSWDAVFHTLTLASGGNELVLDEGNAVSLTLGVSGADATERGIGSRNPKGSIFWTNGRENTFSNITLNVATVDGSQHSLPNGLLIVVALVVIGLVAFVMLRRSAGRA